MNTSNLSKCTFFFLLFLVFSILLGLNAHATTEAKRIAIIPFKMNAEKDVSFLQSGILDMLTSRLYWENKVTVINEDEVLKILESVGPKPLNEETARKIGSQLNADFILFGSLTIFGNSVSIDAKMVDITEEKPTLSFFNQSEGMGGVIPAIDIFAMDINEKVFSRDIPVQKAKRPVQDRKETPDIHQHPEKLIEDGVESVEEEDDLEDDSFPAFADKKSGTVKSKTFWKSKNFESLINGLAIGDVDGDGKIETVFITENSIHIYKRENKRFFQTKEIDDSRNNRFIGIDIADINGNGIPEIFITCLNSFRNSLRSMVFEYKEDGYHKLVDNSPWFYRTVELPDRGSVLFGQKIVNSNPFRGKIFELAWNGSEYASQKQIQFPGRVNLMGFTTGRVMDEGPDSSIAFNDDDYIRVANENGGEIWKGGERYGGNMLYFNLNKDSPDTMENRKYFPTRLIIKDIDSDGKNELLTINNHEMASRMLDQFRKFTSSKIECLTWDGLGYVTKWSTRKTSGRFGDFAIGDFDNDGKDEMVISVILKEGAIIGTKSKSTIIAYDF